MGAAAEASIDLTLAGRTLRFAGDPRDSYFQSLESFHAAAPRLEHYLRRHIREDAVCLDIGANIGLTSMLLATFCPRGRVYAFEASPKNARYLRRNLELNGIDTCVVVEAAVGERPGVVPFRETEFCAGSHVAQRAAGARDPSVVPVPMIAIDGFVEAEKLAATRIDLMKVDVEGFEPAVLAGAASTIERCRCPIFMEFNSWCLLTLQNFNPLAFATAVLDAFQVQRIEGEGTLATDADGSVGAFLYRNLFRSGCVDDILIRLKPGRRVPSLDEMTRCGQDLENLRELRALRAELAALRA
jgi:FkbM family methyltransferase